MCQHKDKQNKLQKEASVYFGDIMHLLSVETWAEALPHIRMNVDTEHLANQQVNLVVEELNSAKAEKDTDLAFITAANRFWNEGKNNTITRINSVGYSYISRDAKQQLVLFCVLIDIDLEAFSMLWGKVKTSSLDSSAFAVLQSWEQIKTPLSIDDLDTILPSLPVFSFLGELHKNIKNKQERKK